MFLLYPICWGFIMKNVFYQMLDVCWHIIWFFIFLLMCCIAFIDFHMLNHPCIPGVNLAWSWCMILLTCWIWIAHHITLRIFTPLFINTDIGLYFFLPCSVIIWFWYQDNSGLMKGVWECLSSSVFWKSLRKIGVL